jgi:predicted nucleotidyltransferase component of viral defense system
MNLFDKLVQEAINHQKDYSDLRVVVEKELLHHDILSILSRHNMLKELTFIGGTALRACYGSIRLSEDLDFTGGGAFSPKQLFDIKDAICDSLHEKYGLKVDVAEPKNETGNVSTWKIKIQTRPLQKDLPSQCIHLDICATQSYEKKPMLLLNPYGVNMGTLGLIIQTQSKEEIYTDKILAFCLRNAIKSRDLWDISWLHQESVKPSFSLVHRKLQERSIAIDLFIELFHQRLVSMSSDDKIYRNYQKEMMRFLPRSQMNNMLAQEGYWIFMVGLMQELFTKTKAVLS